MRAQTTAPRGLRDYPDSRFTGHYAVRRRLSSSGRPGSIIDKLFLRCRKRGTASREGNLQNMAICLNSLNMDNQTRQITQALDATRSDLTSLGQSISSITTYLFRTLENRRIYEKNFTSDGEPVKTAATLDPAQLLATSRQRLSNVQQSRAEVFNVATLREIFDSCSTDKGYLHSYEEIYAPLFELLNPKPKILEIGTGAPESGYAGTPGGSLSAWLQAFPEASVIGVDIHPLDPKYLPPSPTKGTLRYVCADQTSLTGMDQVAENLRTDFGSIDLIIDDGLHAPHAVVPTVLACAPLMHSRSFYVIEDVPPSLIDTYLYVFRFCGLNMQWAPWKTSANRRVNTEEPYPGKDTRVGCAMVGIQQT